MDSDRQSQVTANMHDEEEEPLDPRIQHELEMMNHSSLCINKFEADLDIEKRRFKLLYNNLLEQLNAISSKLGECIHRAMPYYDCRLKAKEAQNMLHDATIKYERALSMQTAALEMVDLAEQGYERKKPRSDMAWKEMLHNATIKLLDAETEKISCQVSVRNANHFLSDAQAEVKRQYKLHKRSVTKSKPYYELKSKHHAALETQRRVIDSLEKNLSSMKSRYSHAMAALETISMEIHNKRTQQHNHNSSTTTDLTDNNANSYNPDCASKSTEDNQNQRSHSDELLAEDDATINIQDNHFTETKPKSQSAMMLVAAGTSLLDVRRNKNETPIRASSPGALMVVTDDYFDLKPAEHNRDAVSPRHRLSDVTGSMRHVEGSPERDETFRRTSDVTGSGKRVEGSLERDEGIAMADTPATTDENDDSDVALSEGSADSSPVMMKKRSTSFIQSSPSNTEQIVTKTRSMSFPSSDSAPELGTLNNDNALARSDSSVLDDHSIEGALSAKYFDDSANNNDSVESVVIMRRETSSSQQDEVVDDYETLPARLSGYQKQYTISRRNTLRLAGDDTIELRLDQILQLLDTDLEEHEV